MERPKQNSGPTIRTKTGCGILYIIDRTEADYKEIFLTLGKTGGCAAALLQALAMSVSVGLRAGVKREKYIEMFKEIRCPNPMWDGPAQNLSCPDALSKVLEKAPSADGREGK